MDKIETLVDALESEESNLSDGFVFYICEYDGVKKLSYEEAMKVIAKRILSKLDEWECATISR